MLYSYISKSDINDLLNSNRTAFVIKNVTTSDIDEYINGIMAILYNSGFDMNKINQPRIISVQRNREYNIVISLKASEQALDIKNKQILTSWLQSIGKSVSLKSYINSVDRNNSKCSKHTYICDNDIHDIIHGKTKAFIEFKQIGSNKRFKAKINLKFDKINRLICSTNLQFSKPIECSYNGADGQLLMYTTDVRSFNNNFRDIIAASCKQSYDMCKLNPIRFILQYNDNTTVEYDILITINSIDFALVK